MPFFIGFLTFFILCRFTLLAQIVALSTADPFKANLMIFFFALGTLPILAILSFTSLKFQKTSYTSMLFNSILGILVIFFLYNANYQLNFLGLASFNDVERAFVKVGDTNVSDFSVQTAIKMVKEGGEEYQEATIKATGFDYLPKAI